MKNEEWFELRQTFRTEIRCRQKESIFSKIRSQALEQEEQLNQSISTILKKISKIEHECINIEGVHDKTDELRDIFGEARGVSYWIGDAESFIKMLEFIGRIVHMVESHIRIDIEDNGNVEDSDVFKNHPFGDLMISVESLLIDLLAQDVQFSACTLEHVLGIIKSPQFLNVYSNMFLCENIEMDLKRRMVNQYINTLSNNPTVYLENCVNFTQILYFAIENEPQINVLTECSQHIDIIKLIDKICGRLAENDKTKIMEKSKFLMYVFYILSSLCFKNENNCRQIINSSFLMANLCNVAQEFDNIFAFAKINFEDYPIDHLISGLGLLSNLTFFDEITSSLHHERPELVLIILKILPKLGLEYWESKSVPLPEIFGQSEFLHIVEKELKIVSNFICSWEICEVFIEVCHECKWGKWVGVLTDIYNTFCKKNEELRLECLIVYCNVFLVVIREGEIKCDNKESWEEDNEKEEEEFEEECSSQWRENMNESLRQIDLAVETLKLTCVNSDILVIFLTIMKKLLEIHHSFKSSPLFMSIEIANRIASIADEDDWKHLNGFGGSNLKRVEGYPNDVKIKAQMLLDVIRIG